jgi:hypothetical protein
MSEVIVSLPKIVPKKHVVVELWQGRKWSCGRPIRQWCNLPAYERGSG